MKAWAQHAQAHFIEDFSKNLEIFQDYIENV
jgi:hypothetical protein